MTDPDRPAVPLARTVRRAGRLLCWSLATAWTAAAVDVTVSPRARWWNTLWPLPWYLTCACAVAWAVLRAREKAARGGHEPRTGTDVRTDWDQAA
ncbi:hypothetical protein ACIQJT_29795 [Streptomyces sp. NPDC091972]|uniref:hypothetical protein n=1 Tax=unclassified Streptomyces TaxID=2593676 RepID=UPI00343FA434